MKREVTERENAAIAVGLVTSSGPGEGGAGEPPDLVDRLPP